MLGAEPELVQVGVNDVHAQDVPVLATSFSGVNVPVPIPVPSLKLASLVPSIFHFAAEGSHCSPKTTDHAEYAIEELLLSF